MKKKSMGAGPNLFVHFDVQDEKITHIRLEEGEQGLTWQVESDREYLSVEKSIHSWLSQYVSGQEPKVTLPLLLKGLPPFTLETLKHLQKVPFGTIFSYQEIAQQLANPAAARAVGNACGRNPLPLVIPCHRVIASGGTLGGFSMGLRIKRILHAFEGIAVR